MIHSAASIAHATDTGRQRSRLARLALLGAFLMAVAAPQTAMATDASTQPRAPEAERAITRLNDRLVGVLNDGTKDTSAREHALANTLRDEIDFNTIASFVLGRYAAGLNGDQRRMFQHTFADYVVGTYSRLLSRNAIAKMSVTASRKVTPDTAAVSTHVDRRHGKETRWVWRVHRMETGHWRIVDLQTAGASLAVNYRSEFGDTLRQQGFDALIQEIRTHTKHGTALPDENQAILMLVGGDQDSKLALSTPDP
ncbi:MlaC/ttg2D family ABC transporter substrate-binding protein [Rhodovibrio salinarum]|nr:ABC transporter substrate-binding protein [Rhodovibrio salinarum]